jgi:hypothetical protein
MLPWSWRVTLRRLAAKALTRGRHGSRHPHAIGSVPATGRGTSAIRPRGGPTPGDQCLATEPVAKQLQQCNRVVDHPGRADRACRRRDKPVPVSVLHQVQVVGQVADHGQG